MLEPFQTAEDHVLAEVEEHVDGLLPGLHFLVAVDDAQDVEQLLGLHVKLHLLLLVRVASVQPDVVHQSGGVVLRLQDLVAVLVVGVQEVETAEGLLVGHHPVLAESEGHVATALPVHQLADRLEEALGLDELNAQQFGIFLDC